MSCSITVFKTTGLSRSTIIEKIFIAERQDHVTRNTEYSCMTIVRCCPLIAYVIVLTDINNYLLCMCNLRMLVPDA